MNRVSTSRLHEVEIANMGQHMIYDAGGEPLESMRDPLYFLPAAHRLRVGDLLEVFWRKDGWLIRYARLRVLRILEDAVHTGLEGVAEYDRDGEVCPVGPDAPPAEPPAPPAAPTENPESREDGGAEPRFVQGEAERKWNVGIQKHEVRQGETVICAVEDKDLADRIAAGEAPIPEPEPAPEPENA